jgi:hypothetical protein
MADSDNILTKLQDLLVYLIPQLNKFPRDQKFVLGDRIETKLLDVQEDCLRAYYSRCKCRSSLLTLLAVFGHYLRMPRKLGVEYPGARPASGWAAAITGRNGARPAKPGPKGCCGKDCRPSAGQKRTCPSAVKGIRER